MTRARRTRGLLLRAIACAFAGWLAHFAAPVTASTVEAGPLPLQPYKARYEVSFRGIVGGQIAASLQPDQDSQRWVYETHAFPNMLGRLAISSAAHERGTMEVTPEGVRPLLYEYDDGRSGSGKDIRITFDWSARQVAGVAEDKSFEFELTPGTQDTASVQAALMRELAAGRSPASFPIITKGQIREYRYWSEGESRVKTPLGEFDAVIWANQRDGSSRVTKVWHAPELGYVPVQAIQLRDGRTEMQMRLIKLER